MADVLAQGTKDQVKQYIEDKNVNALLKGLTEALLSARPDDPEKFLRNHLNESIATKLGVLKIQSANRGRVARKNVVTKKELKRAQKKFEKFDVDGSGTIDGDEIKALAEWVFQSFKPDGQAMGEEEKEVMQKKLLSRLDSDNNTRLDFEEFAEWFIQTCEAINKFRRAKAKKERAGAATKLQGKARQRKAKQKVEGIKQDKAAVKLQGKARQRNAKIKVDGVRQDKAATKLQGKARQRNAKKRVDELKKQQA